MKYDKTFDRSKIEYLYLLVHNRDCNFELLLVILVINPRKDDRKKNSILF